MGGMGGAAVRMPARSLAERARGLRARLLVAGAEVALEGKLEGGLRPLHRIRQVARARRQLAAARGEEALDDPVFQRMEGDDDEAAAGPQQPLGRMQRLDQFVEFAVHMDAQRLEGAGGGMDLVRPRPAGGALDGLDQADAWW